MTRMVVAMMLSLWVAMSHRPLEAQVTASPSDTVRLTLQDALAIARGSSPSYRQAVNNAS